MKHIQLTFIITDDLKIRQIVFDFNDTSLKTDSELIYTLGKTMVDAYIKQHDNLVVQDLLNDLGIKKSTLEL